MRLNQLEIKIIKNTISALDPDCRIILFGSRADDTKKGGDIDLLLLSDKLNFDDKLKILNRLYEELEEQKIDIIIAKDLIKPFVKHVYEEGVAL